jgi:hypothetical protein
MKEKTKDIETQARKNLVKLRKIKGMEQIADSLERLMDGAAAGGVARAKKLTKKRRKEIASNAAKARWGKRAG